MIEFFTYDGIHFDWRWVSIPLTFICTLGFGYILTRAAEEIFDPSTWGLDDYKKDPTDI